MCRRRNQIRGRETVKSIGAPSSEGQSCETCRPLVDMPQYVCVCVSSDAFLLLLILHYNGSLRQILVYALMYPFTSSETTKDAKALNQ